MVVKTSMKTGQLTMDLVEMETDELTRPGGGGNGDRPVDSGPSGGGHGDRPVDHGSGRGGDGDRLS